MNLLNRYPDAYAQLAGSPAYPDIHGVVYFYKTASGTFLAVHVQGLPDNAEACASNIFGFHIHEGSSCTGDEKDPFADTGGHYNPHHCPHPAHAGDLPPLFGSHGHAFMAFLTDRFSVNEVIGHTVVIHASPDDFTTQPSGNSGPKIACGVIQEARA